MVQKEKKGEGVGNVHKSLAPAECIHIPRTQPKQRTNGSARVVRCWHGISWSECDAMQ
jgi:hypothetical protein